MERIPVEKWNEVKEKAEDIYGNYIKEFFFFSPRENTNGKEISASVESIRKFTEESLLDKLKSYKQESLINYYREELKEYSNSLEKTAELYDKNFEKYDELNEEIKKEFSELENKMQNQIMDIFSSFSSGLEHKLNLIYLKSNDNPETFKYQIENDLINPTNIQEILRPIYDSIKEEVTTRYQQITRKTVWTAMTISNRVKENQRNLSIYSPQDDGIETFSINSNLDVDYLFDSVDGFHLGVGGIAAAVGLFALGPIGLLAGALGFLFGESKQTKVVRKAKEDIQKYLNSAKNAVKSEISDILKSHKEKIENKVNESFIEFNGSSKDQILDNFYKVDSIYTNKLIIDENGSVVDCYSNNGEYLTYFPILLKFDVESKKVWDQNADLYFENKVDSLDEKVTNKTNNAKYEISQLIQERRLLNLSILEDLFDDLDKIIQPQVLEHPFIDPNYIKKLTYSNGNKVMYYNDYYINKRRGWNGEVTRTRKKLIHQWNQNVFDLVWDNSRDDTYNRIISRGSAFSDICLKNLETSMVFARVTDIYKTTIKNTKLFDEAFKIKIVNQEEIINNLQRTLNKQIPSFYEDLKKTVQGNAELSQLKTFNNINAEYYINIELKKRLESFINELPKKKARVRHINRYVGRIVLAAIVLIILTINYFYPFKFRLAPEWADLLSSPYTKITAIFIFILPILLQIKARLRLKREIKSFISEQFSQYINSISAKIKSQFKDDIKINEGNYVN